MDLSSDRSAAYGRIVFTACFLGITSAWSIVVGGQNTAM